MLKVGLTGSIAVGKSYVCEVLRELGAFVLDADQTARKVVEPNTVGWQKIVDNFGKEALQSDNTLDRVKLSSIIFSDESKRQLMNSIVHPLVFEAQNDWLVEREVENPNAIAVIDAALMIESGGYKRFEKLVVVWCKPEIQLERLMLRNNLSRDEALKRINAQMPQEEKKRFADYLIDTSDGFDATKLQTIEIYRQLQLLTNEKRKTENGK
ncbi:MAG TPA: dephospho-CoA kinase [Pyrinomonadaceae bacterium]|nr:dephospho-CoA kinase [Pyrinomonadaceae bacterium]